MGDQRNGIEMHVNVPAAQQPQIERQPIEQRPGRGAGTTGSDGAATLGTHPIEDAAQHGALARTRRTHDRNRGGDLLGFGMEVGHAHVPPKRARSDSSSSRSNPSASTSRTATGGGAAADTWAANRSKKSRTRPIDDSRPNTARAIQRPRGVSNPPSQTPSLAPWCTT